MRLFYYMSNSQWQWKMVSIRISWLRRISRSSKNKDSDMWQLIKESRANQLPLEDHGTLSSNKLSSLSVCLIFPQRCQCVILQFFFNECRIARADIPIVTLDGCLRMTTIYKVNIENVLAVRQHPISKPPAAKMRGSCVKTLVRGGPILDFQ